MTEKFDKHKFINELTEFVNKHWSTKDVNTNVEIMSALISLLFHCVDHKIPVKNIARKFLQKVIDEHYPSEDITL